MATDRERFLAIMNAAFDRIVTASRLPGTPNERIMNINSAETMACSTVRQQLRVMAGGSVPPRLCRTLGDALALVGRVAQKYREDALKKPELDC